MQQEQEKESHKKELAEKLIRVLAIDKCGSIIDTEVSWSFNFLKEKINTKLKYLALIKADCICNIEKQLFHYNQITLNIRIRYQKCWK